MNGSKVASIILLIIGAILFSIGLWLYWTTNPISGWASGTLMIGLLFLFGAIIFLCIGQQYDTGSRGHYIT